MTGNRLRVVIVAFIFLWVFPPDFVLADNGFSCPVDPSVVRITVDGETVNHGHVHQSGTGFVVSREGHLLTAFHVVGKDGPNGNVVTWELDANGRELRTITVEFLDEHQKLVSSNWQAGYVNGDPSLDVALLKLREGVFRPVVCRAARLGNNVPVRGIGWRAGKNVYDPIRGHVAPGDPGDIGDRYRIQGNAQPGHSGGPIFDQGGRVIAVLTSGRSGLTESAGETYATPIENVLSMLPETSLCKQTSLRRDTSVACQALAPDDWTTVLRMSHLHFGDKGRELTFREVLVSANFSDKTLNAIKWGSPDNTGTFSRYTVQARKLSSEEFHATLAALGEGSSIGKPGSERPRLRGVDQAFELFLERGEEIGFLSRVEGREVKRGDAARILSYTARVEGIPGGIPPSDPALPDGDVVAVMIDWASSRENPSPDGDDMTNLQLYDTQRAVMQVTVDDTMAFNPATARGGFFRRVDEPQGSIGGAVVEPTPREIIMDLAGLERDTKIQVAWGWKNSPNP